MRASRLLVVVLAALAAAGCLRRGPQVHYAYPPPPPAPAYQAQAQAYPAPASAAAAAQTPKPRGLFTQNASAYRGPLYAQQSYRQQPVYQPPQPVYPPPQPVYQPPAYPPPAAPASCAAPGCSGYPAPVAQAGAAGYAAYAAYQPAGYLPGYVLEAGDRLRITVFGQQGLSNSYAVDAAGAITMPLVGALPARGLTTEQLAQVISERLRQGYIREPQVAIEIEAYRPFFVHGEVTAPGQYPYLANMTVENAIAVAGGFGPRADKRKITVSRTVGGQTTQGAVGLDYPLRPGDTLRVAERWF